MTVKQDFDIDGLKQAFDRFNAAADQAAKAFRKMVITARIEFADEVIIPEKNKKPYYRMREKW